MSLTPGARWTIDLHDRTCVPRDAGAEECDRASRAHGPGDVADTWADLSPLQHWAMA
jgi:hypothetical protein